MLFYSKVDKSFESYIKNKNFCVSSIIVSQSGNEIKFKDDNEVVDHILKHDNSDYLAEKMQRIIDLLKAIIGVNQDMIKRFKAGNKSPNPDAEKLENVFKIDTVEGLI